MTCHPRRAAALFLPVALVLLVSGCDLWKVPTTSDPRDGEFLPPTDPRSVVENIAWCYNNADIDRYTLLLDDDFTFYLDQDDVQDFGLPESWGYDEELRRTRLLFENALAIELSLYLDDGYEPPGETDSEYYVNGVGYSLFVQVDDQGYNAQGNADFLTLRHGGWQGADRWWINKWWDHNAY